MTDTPILDMTIMSASQAQKHVIFNETLYKLDAIVQLGVIDRDLTAPPGSPSEGDVYIPAATATGDWASHENDIAVYVNAAWEFYTPNEGWLAFIQDEDVLVVWTGSAWSCPSLQNVALMGINTSADATNKFAVASAAVLFNNVGNGIQVKYNKNASGDTASFLFQQGWNGYAEVGLCGNNDLSFKASADYTNWGTGLTIKAESGAAKACPVLPSFTVANLPSASTMGAGAMAFVTDANATTFNSVVAGSGSNGVPVTSDGTNWRIG